MLFCGTVVQPTIIIREIQQFPSSTNPAFVETDIGKGYIKGLGNPIGSVPLVAELVAAELGTWIGLKIPHFAVIKTSEIEVLMNKNLQVMQAPMFYSHSVDGEPRDGSDTFLSKVLDKDNIALLVVFDTWTRNWDRYFNGEANSDNLLFVRRQRSSKYDLVPIDHSSCFVEHDFPISAVPIHWTQDINIYGKFPEFDKHLSARSVRLAVNKLKTLDRHFVEQVVNSIPVEWQIGPTARTSLVNMICGRAEFVVNNVEERLVDAPEFEWD